MATMDKESVLRLADPDPELSEFLANNHFPWPPALDYDDPPAAIATMRSMMARFPLPSPSPGVSESDVHITARDGSSLRLRVFAPEIRPKDAPCPLVVMYYGGGFCLGSPEGVATTCRSLVNALGVVCVAPTYRLAPEHPFPFGVLDAWDALQWCAANYKSLGADVEQGFVVSGVSAGANFAAALSHLARDELEEKMSGVKLTGVHLACPSLLQPAGVPDKYKERYLSRTQEACMESPGLSKEMKGVFDACVKGDVKSELYMPFNWSKGHKGLPKTYFQVCGADILRDDGLIYETVLREECGVETKLDIYPGLPHVFWGMFPMLKKANDKVTIDTLTGVGWLLNREPKRLEKKD